ncbi:MAG: type II secretion system GspH family protein [Candidatus Omnitrophica bacterium]|nr:type II secretion system GspH family protein [Candidatus Omnitrophota bacterium]
MVKKGLTLIEVVVAIFLMAIVIAAGILLLGINLNVIKKANELTIATALMQYTIEDIKNIDFPPIYYDTQYKFGDRPHNGSFYKQPEEIDPKIDGNDWTPDYYKNDFIVKRFDFRYAPNGDFILNVSYDSKQDTDLTARHRVDIYILRRRDKYILLKKPIYRTRDGLY